MTRMASILQSLDEPVTLAPHNPNWQNVFLAETAQISKVFAPHRLVAMEHYGSTSVPGLIAKPILDILVGLNEFSLSIDEKNGLQELGYEYIGRARLYERFFLRKRGTCNSHLAVVRHAGAVWCESLAVRDYLRAHPQKVAEYGQFKQQALADGCVTTLEYATYKSDFVKLLVEEAQAWRKDVR